MNRRPVDSDRISQRFESVDDLINAEDLETGGIEVQYGELPLHLYYEWVGAANTLVTFSSGLSPKVKTVPAWMGFGMSESLEMNRLLISDPSNLLSDQLRYAWYAGNKWQPNLQDDIARIIRAASAGSRAILFGVSGGGFAALLAASKVPGSVSVVSSPTTDLKNGNFDRLHKYAEAAWEFDYEPGMTLPFEASVVDIYAQKLDTSAIYVQNAGDSKWLERHFKPFVKNISPDNRFVHLTPYLDDSHNGPNRASFIRLLQAVSAHATWEDLVEAVRAVLIER